MIRDELEQLRAMKQELDTLRRQYAQTPAEEVGDTYGDYRTGHKHTRVLYGYSLAKCEALAKRIDVKTSAIEKKVADLENYLDDIESSEMRDILRLYYADGLSQEEIGQRKGYSRSAITRKIQNYWEEKV